ncbi:hypothetical protein BDV12DRAFT_197816 [Aspergillus spectabilis]
MQPISGPENPLAKRKRVITEARKVQNREAQRAYRQRQKERRDALKQVSRGSKALQHLQIRPYPHRVDNRHAVNPVEENADAEILLPNVGMDRAVSADETPNAPIVASEPWSGSSGIANLDSEVLSSIFASLLPSELESSDSSIDDLLSNTISNDQLLLPLTSQDTADDGFADYLPAPDSTLISTLTSTTTTATSKAITTTTTPLANPYTNTLTTNNTSFLTACAYNAACLGISIERFSSYDCMSLCSPFYRSTPTSTDPKSLLAGVIAANPFVPTHLRPTLPQILIPHHPVFDLIPLPGLRSRAIILSASVPHLVSMVELKVDIIDGGLVCWGGKEGYVGGREKRKGAGGGQPWDFRSWKVAPWFWEKWKLLLDGEGGDLWG